MKKLLALIACIALAITAYIGMSLYRPATPAIKLHINLTRNVASSLFWVAQTAGYFKEENLQIEFTSYNSGQEAINDFIKQPDIDYCISFTTPLINQIINGNDLKTLSGLLVSNHMNRFLVKGYPGLDQKESLRNKRIALQMGTSGEYIIYEILARNGLTMQDVQLINMPGSEIPKKINTNAIDGFIVWSPYLDQAIENLSSKNIAYWEPDPGYYQDFAFLITDYSRFNKNKEAHTRLLKSLHKAMILYAKSPEHFVTLSTQFTDSNYKKDMLLKDLKEVNLTLGLTHEMDQELQLELQYACVSKRRCDEATYDRLRRSIDEEALFEVAPNLVRSNISR